MSRFPTNKRAEDTLLAWVLKRIPQHPPETPIADDLLVALATNTLTPAERERVVALLAADPVAREHAEFMMIEAEETGIAAAPARPRLAGFARVLTRQPALRIAAGLILTTTVAVTTYQASRHTEPGDAPRHRDIASSVPSPFEGMQRLTDLGFEPGSNGRADGKAALTEDNLPSARELGAAHRPRTRRPTGLAPLRLPPPCEQQRGCRRAVSQGAGEGPQGPRRFDRPGRGDVHTS